MDKTLKEKIVKGAHSKKRDETKPKIVKKFKLATKKENQFLAFLKPEVFFGKTPTQSKKIVDLALKKFEKFNIEVNGAAIFPGPALGKFSIMDKHYGVINKLSKGASKILLKDEIEAVYKALGIKDKKIKVMGGHEVYEAYQMSSTFEFDQMWQKEPSTKIKSGFYVRPMVIKNEKIIVVNGFHPHQLAHYTDKGRALAVFLVASDTSWKTVREDMLGDSFPEKAKEGSIRGEIYKNAKKYGFEKVTISNNIMHISAGPTEFLFEASNFLKAPFGVNLHKEVRLSRELKKVGLKISQIEAIMHNQSIHSQLEHKDTNEAIKLIKSLI